MKSLVLYRYTQDAFDTQGLLFIDGRYVADTLELPWDDNKPQVSCIPEGVYSIKRFTSPHNGECLQVGGVPNRSCIEMHAGNDTKDTEGCILPGVKVSKTVTLSRQKLQAILMLLGDEEGTLEIKRLP